MAMNLIVIAMLIQWMGPCSTGEDPERNFKNPPAHVKPWVYWINMDGHLTREGITADLEAMKEAGIGGMIYFTLRAAWAGSDQSKQSIGLWVERCPVCRQFRPVPFMVHDRCRFFLHRPSHLLRLHIRMFGHLMPAIR